MHRNPFSDAEIDGRIDRFRTVLVERGLDAAILSSPENVFYFTGLDHWGYFAPHMLVLPLERQPVLVTRAMEETAVGNMVRSAGFQGHSDSETAADVTARVLKDLGLTGKRIGIESWSAGLSHGLARSLQAQAEADWQDVSGEVDALRLVKSPEEQALIRQAARVTDAATQAAIDAIGEGVQEREVGAACLGAMARAGGDPPGFGPFIRPQARLGEEHTTWGQSAYRGGETVFLELAGCVGRYNTPNGRLVQIGPMTDHNRRVADLSQRAFDAVLEALRPGRTAREVYAAWQAVVDEGGLSHYRRHHCGYCVGIAFPPTWTGGNSVMGLRHDSDLEIRTGMTFHVMSWLMGTGQGDFFLSNCVLLGEQGPEVLTTSPHINEA